MSCCVRRNRLGPVLFTSKQSRMSRSNTSTRNSNAGRKILLPRRLDKRTLSGVATTRLFLAGHDLPSAYSIDQSIDVRLNESTNPVLQYLRHGAERSRDYWCSTCKGLDHNQAERL